MAKAKITKTLAAKSPTKNAKLSPIPTAKPRRDRQVSQATSPVTVKSPAVKSVRAQQATRLKGPAARKLPTADANQKIHPSSKLAEMLKLLRQPGGTTLDALCAVTGWQTHSVRGALSGAIKKRLGLTVQSVKTDGVRTYHIAG
jgi:hypothetical protein